VQYSEFKNSVAIISDDITLVLPATTEYPLRFLQLPLIDGMVCQATDGQDQDTIIKYRRATGYQISEGVKRAVDEIHLVLGDQAQSVAFAQSVQSRVAIRSEDTSPVLEPKQSTRRTSYASIDLSQSRETSAESEEETNSFEHIPEWAVSINLPSHVETQGAADSLLREERTTVASHNWSALQIDPFPQLPSTNNSPKFLLELQRTREKEAGIGSAEQKSATPSSRIDGVASDSMKSGQRRLKRPSAKGAGDANRNNIDWDEDLRDDDVESEAPAEKKLKTTSKKTGKSKNATTSRTSRSKSKGGNNQEKTSKSQAMLPLRTTRTTIRRRTDVTKSAKYVQESESDLDHEDDEQPSSVVQDSNSLMGKNALSKKDEIHVDDSQGQEDGEGLNSYELDSIIDLPAEGSSSAAPRSAASGKETVQDETANDSLTIDTATKAETLAGNGTSFGTTIAKILTTKAHLPVAAIEQRPRTPFGNANKFVEMVNVTRNSSPQKSAIKHPQITQPGSYKATIHHLPSRDQSPADSTAQHPRAEAHAARPSKDRPETRNIDKSPAEEDPQSDCVHMIYKDAAPRSIPQKVFKRTAPTSIPEDDLDKSLLQSIPRNDFDLAALAVTQVTYQEMVATAITKSGDTVEEILVQNSNIPDESPEKQLSKPASMVSKWSPSKRESRKMLPKIHQAAEARKAMEPPPLPRRSDCRSVPSPINFADDEGNNSLLITNERTPQKTPIVSFGTHGPRNQGVVSPSKQLKVARIPPETGKHAAAILQRIVPSEHVLLPELAVTSDQASCRYSQAINNDEGILVQQEIIRESLAVCQGSDVTDKDEGVLAQEKSAVEVNAGAGAASRRNASQSSKVDENGSPRLHKPRKALISPAKLLVTSTTSEQSESSACTLDEFQHSVYTEDNSSIPATTSPEHRAQRAEQHPKTKMIQTRASIGLEAVLSQNFPESSKSLNTAAFKKQSKATLSVPPVALEKISPGVQEARNVPQPKLAIHPKAVDAEIDHAPASLSPQHLLSDPNTRVTRLGPQTPLDTLKVVEEANPAPASFKTSFRNMLMRPPPLPPPRQGQSDLRAAPAGKGKRKCGFAAEDEDLTLIGEVDFVEHRPVRQVIRPQRQQSPDSSTDSQSSPIPEQMHANSRKQDPGSLSSETRPTQQHILNVLSRVATVGSNHLLLVQWSRKSYTFVDFIRLLMALSSQSLISDRAYFSVFKQQSKLSREGPMNTI
jgi:hypothetical protein